MNSIHNFTQKISEMLLTIIGTIIILLPTSPINMKFSYRDSGVFLYMGAQILHGALPYRDVWDHKPPVIYYLNALGLAISNGSRWGVWFIELIGLTIAAYTGYRIIQKFLGTNPAILSSILWLTTLEFVIQGGNLTTEYTLPLQFVAIWIAIIILEKQSPTYILCFLLGLLFATIFFTKQTAVGVCVAIVVTLLIFRLRSNNYKQLLHEIISILCGFVIVCIFWIAFFGMQGGLIDFWNAAFKFNFIYSSSEVSILARVRPAFIGITPLTKVGLLSFGGIGFLLGLFMVFYKRDLIQNWLPLLIIGLIDFPLELLLISASGRMYPHYYMTIIPVLAFFSSITFWVILSSRLFEQISQGSLYFLTICIAGVFIWVSFNQYKEIVKSFGYVNDLESNMDYLIIKTQPQEKLLLWGQEAAYNFYSNRDSPSRFVYQYPLYVEKYVDEQMIIEFLDDLIEFRPRLIIDTNNPLTPIFEFPIHSSNINQKITEINCHYKILNKDQFENWTILELEDNNCLK